MRQAIEEGYILDVLESYTTYSTYFELLENQKAPPGYEVETAKGRRLLMKHVGKHPHTVESKAKIMLDHFFSKTVHKIGGEAKAMVVTSSRAHAVLYKQAFDKLLHDDYADQTKALVAFSGKVTIKGYDEAFTEENMNPKDAKDIREAFKKHKYRILIVANKFQTGFDQPLLHTMYVDKKLGGVATVQTLSRLNRKGPPAKQDTMVLDFANKQEDIEKDFQDYYGQTSLDRGTDPQKLYNMKFEVEEMAVFTPEQVEEFAKLFVIEKAPGKKISPLFSKIIQGTFAKFTEENQDKFREVLRHYVTQYSFVSQIITWIDPELEKFYLFTKLLLKYLPPKKDSLPEEILDMVDMDKFRLQETENGCIVLNPGDTEMENTSGDGHGGKKPQEKEKLEVIVKELNDRFKFDFEDRDKVMSIVIPKLAKDEGLIAAFQTNNLETLRKQKFADSLESAFISSAGDFYSVLNRMSAEPDFKRLLTEFALVEFKRGLEPTEAKAKSERYEVAGQITILTPAMVRSNKLIKQQFGTQLMWSRINQAVWAEIGANDRGCVSLSEVDAVAKTTGTDANDVLAILALLSRPGAGVLKMEYLTDEGSEVSREELGKKLKAWWKEKTISDDQWRSWAEGVQVKWSPISEEEAP